MWEMVCDGNKSKCWLDLSEIGKDSRNYYNWKNSIGCKIGIRYKWLRDEMEERWFEIIDYDKNSQKLTLKWNNEVYNIVTHALLKGCCGNIFGKFTSNFKYEIGEVVKTKSGELTIIDRYYKQDESGTRYKWYKYQCENGHGHETEESNLKQGRGCPHCSDGVPITERFMSNLLFSKNIEFIFQASKRNFSWIKNNKFYDFALPSYKTIIEIDGDPRSHDNRENDDYKDEMAKTNGWNMIRINLLENYTGSFEQLWGAYKPVLNYLGVYITDEEAKDYYKKSQKSIFRLIVNIANENPEFSQQQIANKLKEKYGYKLTKSTINNYLKKSNESGLTNYKNKDKKAVICITTGKIYKSCSEAVIQTGINNSSIMLCCQGKYKYAGVIDKKPAIWMFLDDYEKLTKEEIEKIKNQKVGRKVGRIKTVICITTGKIYESCHEAERQTGINNSSITLCCQGKYKYAGKLNGEKLVWMYYDEYLEGLK